MCRGISVLKNRIRQELYEEYELSRFLHKRGECEELWFDFAERVQTVLLPVICDGQLLIRQWGNRSGAGKLPKTGWCKQESLTAGKWRWLEPQPVEIPADFGLEKGIWFGVTQGMRGILVHDHVYMLTEPASHYYEVMTRHDRMPVLIDQVI
jgi:hypothetical protein